MSAGPYQLLPRLTTQEEADLTASIHANGVLVPVLVDEEGEVIDGHHRQAIADHLGLDYPTQTVAGLTEAEKRNLALRLNLDRRHLTREQKREVIEASLLADPELSNRQHAERTGASHNTVGSVRGELESTGQLDQSETRTSADGRERPATQTHTRTTTDKTETRFDAESGEILDESPTENPAPPAGDPVDEAPDTRGGSSGAEGQGVSGPAAAAPGPSPSSGSSFASVGELIDWCPDSGQWLTYEEMQRSEATKRFGTAMNRRLPRDADQDIAGLCPPEAIPSAIFAAEVAATYWLDLAADLKKLQHPSTEGRHLAAVEV